VTRFRWIRASLLALVTAGTLWADALAEEQDPPRLIVVISVDGLSPMQIARVEDLFTGGLARLLEEGARFDAAYQDHAMTMTGPGHFVLMSGQFPGPAGIVANSWWEGELGRWVYCVEDTLARLVGASAGDGAARAWDDGHRPHLESRQGVSYRNVGASSFSDWLEAEYPESRVFSFSRKDRAAVMLGGRSADGVYWFDGKTGRFVTSTFYTDVPHAFVETYNDRQRPRDYRHQRWERLIADPVVYEARARADSFPGEVDISSYGTDGPTGGPMFDHWIADGHEVSDEIFYDCIEAFPFVDEMTMELAHEAITAMELGRDDVPDLLCIGLSSLDAVSHATGVLSQESIDVVLRVDRLIGELLERLDRELGPRYVVALSSDHGMLPLPEYLEQGHRDLVDGVSGRRVGPRAKRLRERLHEETAALCGGESPIAAVMLQGIWIDWATVRASGASADAVDHAVRRLLGAEPWIDRVFSRQELLAGGDTDDPIARRFQHATHPASSPDYTICVAPGTLTRETGTTHGSPHDYDAHVPLVVWGPGVVPGAYDDVVATVDLAPTLARLAGVTNVPNIDGRALELAIDPSFRIR
jgi:predicted AlkP superfamily pyrophosphatase or phosphodiesterase